MRYSKQISTGVILESQSGGNPDNPTDLQVLVDNAVNSGIPAGDVEVGYCTTDEQRVMLDAAETAWDVSDPMRKWKRDMATFKLSREVEDLITEGSLSMNAYQKTIYDAKVARRAEKP
mgnify:CR=1 FL=1